MSSPSSRPEVEQALIIRSIRYQVMNANLLDYKSEANKLIELIRQYEI